MKREMKIVEVASLIHAEWNPRTEAELDSAHPEMQKLIASVRELGVVQPIAVWQCDDCLKVIAGNRRFAAAEAVGLETIQAVVFDGITLAQAQEITRVENEVRLGVNPIQDAGLIASMMRLGYSQCEIAAHFGVSEATVCRRAKLIDLSPKVREAMAKGGITTMAMEKVALFPADIQEKCYDSICRAAKAARDRGVDASWESFKWDFERLTMDLNSAKFDTDDCVGCLNRTGAQPDLWGEMTPNKDGTMPLGECLDGKCFERHYHEFVEALVRAKVGEGVEIVEQSALPMDSYELDEVADLIGARRKKSFPVAYYDYNRYNGEIDILWGLPLEEIKRKWDAMKEELARSDAERRAEVERKRSEFVIASKEWHERRDALEREFNSAYDTIGEAFGSVARGDMVELIKKHILPKGCDELLAKMIFTATDDYSFCRDNSNWLIRLCELSPKFAKAIKVKPKDLAEASAKWAAIVKFEADNPKPEMVYD